VDDQKSRRQLTISIVGIATSVRRSNRRGGILDGQSLTHCRAA
jgi:hypothetical protein